MSVLTPSNLPQLVDLVDRIYYKGWDFFPYEMRNAPFVNVQPRAKNTGLTSRLTERISVQQFAQIVDPGAQIPEAEYQYGYEKDLKIYQVALNLVITLADREGAKDYGSTIGDMIMQFAKTVPTRLELDLAHRLTFAYVSSYTSLEGKTIDTTCGDGFPLAYNAHTLTGSATTYSTIVTGNPAFSKGALEVALKQFYTESYDNFGVRVRLEATSIGCAKDPNTMNQIDELLNATADVQSANAGTFNAFGSSGQYKMRRFTISRLDTTADGGYDSTKSKMWFVACDNRDAMGICAEILTEPTLSTPANGNNGQDIYTGNWIWSGVSLYGIAVPGARWIRISSGTGSNLSS